MPADKSSSLRVELRSSNVQVDSGHNVVYDTVRLYFVALIGPDQRSKSPWVDIMAGNQSIVSIKAVQGASPSLLGLRLILDIGDPYYVEIPLPAKIVDLAVQRLRNFEVLGEGKVVARGGPDGVEGLFLVPRNRFSSFEAGRLDPRSVKEWVQPLEMPFEPISLNGLDLRGVLSTCAFCDTPARLCSTKEHALPKWVLSRGAEGATMPCCEPCNNGRSATESRMQKLSEQLLKTARKSIPLFGTGLPASDNSMMARDWALEKLDLFTRVLELPRPGDYSGRLELGFDPTADGLSLGILVRTLGSDPQTPGYHLRIGGFILRYGPDDALERFDEPLSDEIAKALGSQTQAADGS